MEAGKEQNYWPGFVDALSNVVLTLVFVLVVFVFALVISSNKVERKAQEMIQAAHEQTKGNAAPAVALLQKELEKAKAEIKELKQNDSTSSIEKTTDIVLEEKSGLLVVGEVKISKLNGKIVIIFPKAVSDLDDPSFAALSNALDELKINIKNKKVSLRSYIGLESYSAARRLAYYRVLGLRNFLIDKKEVKGAAISSQILQPKEPQDGRVEIILD